MSLSAQEVSHENLETASAFRTEAVTGSHQFKVFEYSLIKGIGIGKYISSDVFTIGGYDWVIRYVPDGNIEENKNYICFDLHLESAPVDHVKARFTFTILEENGAPSNISKTSSLRIFNSKNVRTWGYKKFTKRSTFEVSNCLKDDAFTLKCTVTVVKGTKLEVISPFRVIVPPSNLSRNWADLLESGIGADVTFVVKGERFDAHRCVLAARSAVFNAMLFSGMKENGTDAITVDDMEVSIFQSMLYFIYSVSVPDFATTRDDDDNKKNDSSLVAQHLLVAADRYGLERLRLMCEDILCKNLVVGTITTILIFSERHNCAQLKAECLRFMSSSEVFKEVATTPGFQNLLMICPSIVMDIKALHLIKCHI